MGAHGTELRFRRFQCPPGVSLSAVLPSTGSRCGIYVLHFSDGEAYVGQALDVLTRFASHRRRWGDIVAVQFAPARPEALDELERQTIQDYERKKHPLRNVALVGLPMGESTLDVVIDRIDQQQWLLKPHTTEGYDLTARVGLARQRQSEGRSARFLQLADRPDYEMIRAVLWDYLMVAVPWPHETESRFWSVTAMPSTNRSSRHRRLCAISVNNVETLVLMEDRHRWRGWTPRGFVNVAPGTGGPGSRPGEYRTTGPVDTIEFRPWSQLQRLLRQDTVGDGARRTVLGLMRKGRGMMARYHDPALADDLFTHGHGRR